MDLSHKKLEIWKNGINLVESIYLLTASFPKEEQFGLTNQLRRASVSVVSNIAEGLSRTSPNEKIRFLEVARSSIVEIDTQIEIAIRIQYCSHDDVEEVNSLLNTIFAMSSALIKTIKLKLKSKEKTSSI
ncbi:MAG TPA: four helix bundle protein [Ignavibacteriaceae bacterium]|jgi:four helix bundle protein|nr:four helix bundle protein [Ignavibacteriaceae bacterium]